MLPKRVNFLKIIKGDGKGGGGHFRSIKKGIAKGFVDNFNLKSFTACSLSFPINSTISISLSMVIAE